jgi:hypothetical protein
MSYNDVFLVLSKVRPGDTICSDLTIVEHKTWFSTFKRSWKGDTRDDTIRMIENAMKDFEEKQLSKLSKEKIEYLDKVREGIKALTVTYSDDPETVQKLESMRLKLRDLILKLSEYTSSESTDEFDLEFPHSDPVSVNPFKEDETPNNDTLNLSVSPPEPKSRPPTPIESDIPKFETEAKPASKFENYLKKKKRSTCYHTRKSDGEDSTSPERTERGTESYNLSSGNISRIRRLPKLRLITMGDVLSDIENLPESIPNPLSIQRRGRGEHNLTPSNVKWYTENIIRR